MFSVMTRQWTFPTNKTFSVLCYVGSLKNIREEFSGFRHCGEETNCNAIEFITNSVRDLGLTMDNCRG